MRYIKIIPPLIRIPVTKPAIVPVRRGFRLSTIYQGVKKLEEKTFTGLYVTRALLDNIGQSLERANCRTRNEFINKAIRFYISYLETGKNSSTLFPILDNALDGRMKDTESRISRSLFKLAVEVAMMTHVVAGTNEIPNAQLASLRKLCTDEVARLSGRYSLEDAVKFQS